MNKDFQLPLILGDSVHEVRDFLQVNSTLQQGTKSKASEQGATQKVTENGIIALCDSYKKTKMEIVESFNCYTSLMVLSTNNVVAKCITCHTNLCSPCVNSHLFNNR